MVKRKGFTLIELLVVVAIIALLISILLPSLQRAREQGKKAKCLANLHNMGQSAHMYAEEDDRGLLMPVHEAMLKNFTGEGEALGRFASWYSWGGHVGTELFARRDDGTSEVILDNQFGKAKYFGANARPLTKYMYPEVAEDEKNLGVFDDPGDKGYPSFKVGTTEVMDDFTGNHDKIIHKIVGSSIRGSLAQYRFGGGGAHGLFSVGILGQPADRISEASRMLWGGDPGFYNFIGTDQPGGFGDVKINGWHGDFMAENELFADASARTARAVNKNDPTYAFSPEDRELMGIVNQAADATTRGPDWKLDCYPDPGASFGQVPNWPESGWPMRNRYSYPLPRRLSP